MLSDAQFDRLHRLSALVAPKEREERERLKRQLAAMLRLVKGVVVTQQEQANDVDKKEALVDARPLSVYDPHWSVSLCASSTTYSTTAEAQGTHVLDRDAQLLAKVDERRKYQGYFVVDRT